MSKPPMPRVRVGRRKRANVHAYAVDNVLIAAISEQQAINCYRSEFPNEARPTDIALYPAKARIQSEDGSVSAARDEIRACGAKVPQIIGYWEDRV